MVIEIKQLPPKPKEKQADLNKRINGALKAVMTQIGTKKYYKELVAHRIEKIIKLPIVFVGKSLVFRVKSP